MRIPDARKILYYLGALMLFVGGVLEILRR